MVLRLAVFSGSRFVQDGDLLERTRSYPDFFLKKRRPSLKISHGTADLFGRCRSGGPVWVTTEKGNTGRYYCTGSRRRSCRQMSQATAIGAAGTRIRVHW